MEIIASRLVTYLKENETEEYLLIKHSNSSTLLYKFGENFYHVIPRNYAEVLSNLDKINDYDSYIDENIRYLKRTLSSLYNLPISDTLKEQIQKFYFSLI